MITHKLTIGGEDWSHRLISANIEYKADVGSSGMQLEMTGSVEDYEDAPVKLYLGEHKNLQPYFKGKIQGPDDDDLFDKCSANAFGPFRNMMTQKLGTDENFVGNTLEYVIFELARRADHANGEILVVQGDKYRVQPGEQFPFDNNMGDVLTSLLEKAEFVGVDQPEGKRVFKPKPKPGSNKNYKKTIDPSEYSSLQIKPKEETGYSQVVVFRNGDNGKPVVYADREIINTGKYKPARNRWYTVSDFEGTQQEAEEEAFKLADELRSGLSSFTVELSFDQSWRLHEGFKAIRIKKNQQRTYSCFIDDGITVNYQPGEPAHMTLSGSAFEIKHKREDIKETEKRVSMSSGVLIRPS